MFFLFFYSLLDCSGLNEDFKSVFLSPFFSQTPPKKRMPPPAVEKIIYRKIQNFFLIFRLNCWVRKNLIDLYLPQKNKQITLHEQNC